MDLSTNSSGQTTPVTREAVSEDGTEFVLLGEKTYAVDENMFLNLPAAYVPNILISDLPLKVRYRVTNQHFTVEYLPESPRIVSVTAHKMLNPGRSFINYKSVARILQISIISARKRDRSIWDSSPVLNAVEFIPAFSYRSQEKTLKKMVTQANDLGNEILGPVIEAERLISTLIQKWGQNLPKP
jgi:hypothetical protein